MNKWFALRYVRQARNYGASDYDIALQLGLNQKLAFRSHPLQGRLLEARDTGLISDGDSYYSIARTLGVKNHGTIGYHVAELRKQGKWPVPTKDERIRR